MKAVSQAQRGVEGGLHPALPVEGATRAPIDSLESQGEDLASLGL